MYILYHYPICPLSRKIRILLSEKGVKFNGVIEEYWNKRDNFLRLNPLGSVPTLIATPDKSIYDHSVIFEYIEEKYPNRLLLPEGVDERAYARKLCLHFESSFYSDVAGKILNQRYYNFIIDGLSPQDKILNKARQFMRSFFDEGSRLIEKNGGNYILGDYLSIVDISFAAQISSLDYFGEIPWDDYHILKNWYILIKSRPSFREILSDKIPGFKPYKSYEDLDY
jgi:glutathione S-transferase